MYHRHFFFLMSLTATQPKTTSKMKPIKIQSAGENPNMRAIFSIKS